MARVEKFEHLRDGWAALERGDWQRALDFFRDAVKRDPSPRAYEGLSWAAWWLDDAKTVFDARERAFAAYQTAGDGASAARMATWLGADQLDFNGALALATGWLERAERMLEPGRGGSEYGWLCFHRGFLASIRGDTKQAERLGLEAARLGRQLGVADLEMLGLALEGMSLVSCAKVKRGMRCLDEASALALTGAQTIPISGAWTCCFMVTACTRVLDFERAFEWCDKIAEFAERYGSRYMLGFCRAEYATVHLWRGQWDEAERALEQSLEAFSASRPAMVAGPLVSLAELRRRQGRVGEAQELLAKAGPTNAGQLCQGRLALDAGDARRAEDLAERVRRKLPPERRIDAAPALELLTRARLAQGEFDTARASSASLTEVALEAGTPGLLARANVVQGMLLGSCGQAEVARPLLEDAVDGFERSGASFDAASARIELASVLNAMGRCEDARREAALAHECLKELGASTTLARALAFLGASKSPSTGPVDVLSAREGEVLSLLSEGMTNRAIADRLGISEHTVHRHVTSIFRKLDVGSRTAAAAWALKNRFLTSQ